MMYLLPRRDASLVTEDNRDASHVTEEKGDGDLDPDEYVAILDNLTNIFST